jgi:hypothetical protein
MTTNPESPYGKRRSREEIKRLVLVFEASGSNLNATVHSVRACAERDHANIVSWNFYDRGDHFATQTAPDLLINDIRTFFQKLRVEEKPQRECRNRISL